MEGQEPRLDVVLIDVQELTTWLVIFSLEFVKNLVTSIRVYGDGVCVHVRMYLWRHDLCTQCPMTSY